MDSPSLDLDKLAQNSSIVYYVCRGLFDGLWKSLPVLKFSTFFKKYLFIYLTASSLSCFSLEVACRLGSPQHVES